MHNGVALKRDAVVVCSTVTSASFAGPTHHALYDFRSLLCLRPLWVLVSDACAHELLRAEPDVVERFHFLRGGHAAQHFDHARIASVDRVMMWRAWIHA
jgi:hypothetical protein